jgi:hypothetical protein
MTARIPKIPMDEAFAIIGKGQSIQNNIVIIKRNHYTFSSTDGIKEQFKLTQNNLKQFKEIFGPPEFSYQGEYREYVWFQSFEDIMMVLYTGEHGTTYEIKTDQDMGDFRDDIQAGETIARFLTDLSKKLDSRSHA